MIAIIISTSSVGTPAEVGISPAPSFNAPKRMAAITTPKGLFAPSKATAIPSKSEVRKSRHNGYYHTYLILPLHQQVQQTHLRLPWKE